MFTGKEEKIVYTIAGIGIFAILIFNFKSGFTSDSLLLILKDLCPLLVSVVIFHIVESLGPQSFEHAAKKAVRKIRQNYKNDITQIKKEGNSQKREKYLCLSTRETAFIPLDLLHKGTLEMRVSYGTLEHFGYQISVNDAREEKAVKIKQAQNDFRQKTLDTLQIFKRQGQVSYDDITDEKKDENVAIRIKFYYCRGYERIIEEITKEIIGLKKSEI
jgi:hypothetical protein